MRRTAARAERTAEERERARQERERRRLERQGLPVPARDPQPTGFAAQPVEELQSAPPRDPEDVGPPVAERDPRQSALPVAESSPLELESPTAGRDSTELESPTAARDSTELESPTAETDPVETQPLEPQTDRLEIVSPEPAATAATVLPGMRRAHPGRALLAKPHVRRAGLRRPQIHRPHLHTPHLHRPHLRGPQLGASHLRPPRSLPARAGALAALVAVLGALAAGALTVERHLRHKPIKGPPVVRVLIPEGSTAHEIARLARADGLTGDYARELARSSRLRPSHYGAPAHRHGLEGFLFPATYELYAGAPVSKLLSDQLAAFTENFGLEQLSSAKALGVTPYELLTVASMIEREADLAHERPLVAAVIYNRLRQHMPLGIDATIRYALHDYNQPLTEAQLHSSSPYNTRTHTGLPPTPISNPGRASIEAAAHPAHVSYLYYVARADGCPGQVFSSSYAQFQRDAAAYQQALRVNHGRVPSCRSK